ncbi:LPXTG cell wall anchor domain-containing protein [Atopobiaceae bacterium LCP21S3_F11]
MKHKHSTGAKRGLGGRIAAALMGAVCALCVSATPALAVEASITNTRTKATYKDLATATAEAQSGDTIKLGEGNYTLYGVSSVGHTKGKDLTFVGSGTDKTAWNIGAKVPNPDYYGTEYNSDYSFDGAGTVTFEKMTMRSAKADYLGFVRIDNTVLDGCVVNGKTFYWGYKTAVFKNTTFNAPTGDYALWTYSSPVMTFDGCTFNASGKVINVYTDAGAGKHDITVNVSNCQFNSTSYWGLYKQALNINDSNMGDFKYILNITNSSATAERDNTTCSQLFGFGGKSGNNTGRTDVTIDGVKVWSNKTMLTHDYTDGQHDDNFVDLNDYTWEQRDGDWYCTGHAKCGYCGHKIAETVKATVENKPATCTEAGKTTYTATFTHKCFKPQTKSESSAALDHDWGEPEYSWAKQDDGWYCTAKRTCKRDASHVEQQTVKASVETTPATCTEAGKDVYTATFDGDVFESQTRDDVLPALDHDWGEPEYSWAKQDDGWYCTAKRTCKRDASHVEEETVKAAYEVTTPATTEKDGEGIYTATFENEAFETQTKAEPIAKLPAAPNKPGKADVKPAQNKVTPATPQTGDQTNLAIPVAIAVIGIVVVAGAVIIRRRNK